MINSHTQRCSMSLNIREMQIKTTISYHLNTSQNICLPSCFSHDRLFATLWTVAHQPPLSKGFSREESWSGLPFTPLGDLPHSGTELASPSFPELTGTFFTTSATWEAQSEWLSLKSLQIRNSGKDAEKREPSYTVGGNINWCSHCEQ